jgi:5-formyltetrahydrofolate cyclo-ligase
MEDAKDKKIRIRTDIEEILAQMSPETLAEKTRQIEARFLEFANFIESRVPLMYINTGCGVNTRGIIHSAYRLNKVVVIPDPAITEEGPIFWKVDDFEKDMKAGSNGRPVPDPDRCKPVPVKFIDIALIPGIAFDEKGGRIGDGNGFYDRLIPILEITTRKVVVAYDEQVIPQIPMEPHDKYVDIIITDKRIIYKI